MSVIVTAVLVLVCAVAGPVEAPSGTECTCPKARLANGWCGPCAVGFVAAVEIRSRLLFETLDAHGHDIDPASMECTSCQAALDTDGFCERCRWGFRDKKLYFSRLTWLLAQGEVRDTTKLTCRTCAKNAAKTKLPLDPARWCSQCKVGMVGNVAFKDRKQLDAASRELDRLLRAVKVSAQCEYCAMALFQDATCHKCDVTYRDGKALPVTSTDPAPHTHPHPHPH